MVLEAGNTRLGANVFRLVQTPSQVAGANFLLCLHIPLFMYLSTENFYFRL